MLSKRDIEKELGKGIAIVPFIENNLKDNSINLSIGEHAWGTVSHNCYFDPSKDNSTIYLYENEIPGNKRKYYKSRYLKTGESVIIKRNSGKKVVLLFPHSTTHIETLEVLSTGGNIGGTCHSKVGVAAQGVCHIGTMMGPNYSGNCLVSLHNPTDNLIVLCVGDSFMSVVFNRLDTPVKEKNATIGGHTDKFSSLNIHANKEEIDTLNEDWKRSHETVVAKMQNDPQFSIFKKRLRRQKFLSFFSKKNIIFGIILIALCILLGLLASYLDSKNNTTVWSDRFWTVMACGVVTFILQLMYNNK